MNQRDKYESRGSGTRRMLLALFNVCAAQMKVSQMDMSAARMSDTILIIDDVHAALDLMSGIGQAAVREPALAVRHAVLDFAVKRGWSIVAYRAFADWADGLVKSNTMSWIVLDPLFHAAGASNVFRFRLSRVGEMRGFDYGPGWGTVPDGPIALLDDAAASGYTLRHVTRWLERSGRRVERYAVCASSRTARESIVRGNPHAKWSQLVAGDCTPIHLRDGCAHLPFAGRRVDIPPISGLDGTPVEFRSAGTTVVGTPWHSLNLIAAIRNAVDHARRSVVRTLSVELGRPAVVADLPLMGTGIPAWTDSDCAPPEATSRLIDLLPQDAERADSSDTPVS